MRLIDELERTTNALKERWVGHPDIPPRVFVPEEFMKAQKIQVKPMLTSETLPTAGPQSKLVPPQGLVGFKGSTNLAQSGTEEAQRVQMS